MVAAEEVNRLCFLRLLNVVSHIHPTMSGEPDKNKEFYEQLRLEELYGENRSDPDKENPYTYVDPEDGTVYDWDHDKKAWFPKITDDFIAAYQANYGFNESSAANASGSAVTVECNPTQEKDFKVAPAEGAEIQQRKGKGEKRKPDPGLPPDITPDEFAEMMSKCGIIMRDPVTEEFKVKLYKDAQGNLKGDGLCCYLKKESVELAVRLIDESEIRGYKLHVESAHFELKGEDDASKKRKKNKDYKKKLQQQQKQLDWRPEKKQGESRYRFERVVIIRNMFHPKDFEEDPLVLNEISEDLRTECEKFGPVKKVVIFDRHPDGVASVAFKEPEQADGCKLALHGRWFGGRQLTAELWDGVTDYQVEETTREREERLKGWTSFLESDVKESSTDSSHTSKVETPAAPMKSEELPSNKKDPSLLKGSDLDNGNKEEKAQGNGENILLTHGADSTDSSLAGSDDEPDEETS
uniref:17S U2 SnRNP complex component HTATSF1 n=1 Tax=Erpetoichthys calabaricus TaxID=27687 RepID=A0A8C4SNY0_ERPCA